MEGDRGALSTVGSAALSIFLFIFFWIVEMWTENMDQFLPSENKKDETVEVFFFFL